MQYADDTLLTHGSVKASLATREVEGYVHQTNIFLNNSRPLAPLSEDPDDLEILTPNHFLTGRSPFQVMGGLEERTPRGMLDRFAYIQFFNQQFLKIWQREV